MQGLGEVHTDKIHPFRIQECINNQDLQQDMKLKEDYNIVLKLDVGLHYYSRRSEATSIIVKPRSNYFGSIHYCQPIIIIAIDPLSPL